MVQLAHGWQLDVERGPNCLFVRPRGVPPLDEDGPSFGETVWDLLEQSFVHVLVLEFDDVAELDNYLVGQLIWLDKRIHASGGLMRVTGLSPKCQKVVRKCQLEGRFPACASRAEALVGHWPR